VPATEPKLPNWDMSPYFAGPDADDFIGFRDQLCADLLDLRRRSAALTPLAESSRASWVTLLVEVEDAAARLGHVRSYLGCMAAADANDDVVEREIAGLGPLGAELEKATVAIGAQLKASTDEEFEALIASSELAGGAYYLQRLRRRAEQSMPLAQEELSADLAVTGLNAWGRLYDRLSGHLSFELAITGRPTQTLPVSMTRSLLEDPDPAVRTSALRGSAAAWERAADTVAACLNAISGTRLALYERRGVAHYLDPALFDAGVSRQTIDVMFGTVRTRQDVARRYLARKARLFGLDRLGFQDLSAPIAHADVGSVSFDQARQRIVDAFRAEYPALAEFAEQAFAGRWIDHEPRVGKRPGGFCSTSPVLKQSRIFMTYNQTVGDVQTLAHELGHAFHSWLLRDMRYWACRYPMTLAETASTFAEGLVTDAVLADERASAGERAAILSTRLHEAEAFLLNIPMRFDFECQLYRERANGELSVRRLNELMVEAQRANYGDALADDQLDPWFWASKLHFYITDVSFYNFPYTFGYLFSSGISARARTEGPEFLPRYEELLRRTGSESVESLARNVLGVDLQTPTFWNQSIDRVESDLQQFEKLVDQALVNAPL
jgi:oligoendopeptidase F